MDKGFYSSINNNYFIKNNCKYIIAVPFTNAWAKDFVKQNKDNISKTSNFLSKYKCYAIAQKKFINGCNYVVHIYYDPNRKSSEEVELNLKVQEHIDAINRIKNMQKTTGNKYTQEEMNRFYKMYGTYLKLVLKNTGIFCIDKDDNKEKEVKTFEYAINEKSINNELSLKGFMIILTNDTPKNNEEILTTYSDKEIDEIAYDDLKNLLDLYRL